MTVNNAVYLGSAIKGAELLWFGEAATCGERKGRKVKFTTKSKSEIKYSF
jgi:hypothetical protein